MEMLHVSSGSAGRIQPFSSGERPVLVTDGDDKKIAVAAGVAFVIAFLTVLVWPRKRTREESAELPPRTPDSKNPLVPHAVR